METMMYVVLCSGTVTVLATCVLSAMSLRSLSYVQNSFCIKTNAQEVLDNVSLVL